MPRTPQIQIREISNTGLLKEERFYRLLAIKCGYVDEETARRFYLGLVKLVTQELRTYGVIRLPHLGYFTFVRQQTRSALAGYGRRIIASMNILKFIPMEAMRRYFNRMQQDNKMRMDPREKVLKQNLQTLL